MEHFILHFVQQWGEDLKLKNFLRMSFSSFGELVENVNKLINLLLVYKYLHLIN